MLLLALLIFPSVFSTDVPVCNGPIEFNPPQNLSAVVYYPDPKELKFPDNYKCVYKINVPSGWSAQVTLDVQPESNISTVSVVDFNQRVERVYTAPYDQFYFINPGGRIILSTQSTSVNFQFAVRWYSNFTFSPKRFYNVSSSDSQPLTLSPYHSPFQITADTRVAAIVMPSSTDAYDYWQYVHALRSVLLFDGPSSCLGNAWQLLTSPTPFVSTGRNLFVVQLQPMPYDSDNLLMFQDLELVKELGTYRGIGIQLGKDQQIILDASKMPAGFSTYQLNDCLTDLSGSGSLEVYNGGKTDSKENMIISYSCINHTNLLPQQFRGNVRTYVLTSGVAKLNISRSTDCNNAYPERKGFFMTPNYKAHSNISSFYDTSYLGDDTLKSRMNYTFSLQAFVPATNRNFVEVTVERGATIVYHQIYNSTNIPPVENQTANVYGDWLIVRYSFSDAQSPVLFNFELVKPSSIAAGLSYAVLLVLSFSMFY